MEAEQWLLLMTALLLSPGQVAAPWPASALPCLAAFLRDQNWRAVEIAVDRHLTGKTIE